MLHKLIDLMVRSALLRINQRAGLAPHWESGAWDGDRSHWYVALNDGIRRDMVRLGREFRCNGADLTGSPVWPLLEFKDSYTEAFERNRKVLVLDLTPLAIYECLDRLNTMHWNGWRIKVGGQREVTDGYGLPAWEHRVWVLSPDKTLNQFSGLSKSTARRIYEHMMGHAFQGDDKLGDDPPHRYEPSYRYEQEHEEQQPAMADPIQLPDGRMARPLQPGELLIVGDLYGEEVTALSTYTQQDRDEWGPRMFGESEYMPPFYRVIASMASADFQLTTPEPDMRWEGICIVCNEKKMVGLTTMCDGCVTSYLGAPNVAHLYAPHQRSI